MSEWGPWIEHDGRGCPIHGLPAQWQFENSLGDFGYFVGWVDDFGNVIVDFFTVEGRPHYGTSWGWEPGTNRIIRYRIRKSRALEQLREIARNPERKLEDA